MDQNHVEAPSSPVGLLRKSGDVDESIFEDMDFTRSAAYEYRSLSLEQLRRLCPANSQAVSLIDSAVFVFAVTGFGR